MNNLKELRTERNLKQKDVALKVGITTSYYGMIESGTRVPSLAIAIKLSEYFGVSIEKIFLNTKTTKCCLKERSKYKRFKNSKS
ncbi:helix-turn-helix transcriptional regulator [Clostridioides difficile]|uniref:helix-turn-helix transcriptional regulator n=1 Tax=Clostridioides difficile TaxID=1496 RepID=UPI00097FE613|nr:helix-turn-helix transcriptional regulator [Clostridioides difficile]EGT4599899.1 XRE family transcriptional regulator [Clostridioides difficile]MBY2230548.1 helix-turn-helix transcriptional regulator [Clostridioides difficile]MCV2271298.1 helix-turn-helix transcriptional regulator [Clostridioides difficile]MDV9710146.1 helix-turn-helix transcriptional regulator [Clostridioides difficile]SJP03700.1 Predicted transcriptional regulator [Clostridioides difficile]